MGTSEPAVIEGVPSGTVVPSCKRQHRSREIKRKIVEETLVPGASVARVARAHGVNANQVFEWRRLYRAGQLGAPIASASRLLPVSVCEEAAKQTMVPPAGDVAAPAPSGREVIATAPGTIHLEVREARLRIEGKADPVVLRLLLKALLG